MYEEAPIFNPINNHVSQGLARLITQYRFSSNLQGLLTAVINPLQDIEGVLTDLNNLRYLPNAFGAQLDVIGIIVGLPRPPGMDDATYKLELYGQIKINVSQGQPEQAIQVFQLFTQVTQVRLIEMFPAEVLVESAYNPPDVATVNQLLTVLGEVLPAGVRPDGIVVYDPVIPFSYAGIMFPAGGYGTVSGPGGGHYGTIKTFTAPFGYGVNNTAIKGYGSVLDPYIGGKYAS